MTKITKVNKRLNQLMAETTDIISDTANIYAPGDREVWNGCVKVYHSQILKLFKDLKESCSNLINENQRRGNK